MTMHHDARRGETLLEVLVSVSILMLLLPTMAGTYIQSKRYTEINRRNLMAEGPLEEPIEAMIGLHATNLLKFSAKETACWKARGFDARVDVNNCEDAGNQIAAGWYRLIIGPEGLGVLDLANVAPLSENNLDPFYELFVDEKNGIHNHFLDDTHLYLHPTINRDDPSFAENWKLTGFYRGVQIEYLPPGVPAPTVMKVTSLLLYRMGNRVRQLKRHYIITPHS